jgi:uncharacterized linocin/CFP29 family protein
LGTLELLSQEDGAGFAVRSFQPLVEVRAGLTLGIWNLDDASRGNDAIGLEPLQEAARAFALFEEKVIYQGFKEAGIKGLTNSSIHPTIECSGGPEVLLDAVSSGIACLESASVEGPYLLLTGSDLWRSIAKQSQGYRLKRRLEQLLQNPLVLNSSLNKTVLASKRGGDMRLTVGQDASIGYETHDSQEVRLFFTESFTFQVLDGAAIVPIEWKAN